MYKSISSHTAGAHVTACEILGATTSRPAAIVHSAWQLVVVYSIFAAIPLDVTDWLTLICQTR